MISFREMAHRLLRRNTNHTINTEPMEEVFREKDIIAITKVFKDYGIENYTFNNPPVSGPLNVLYGRVQFASEKDLFLYNIRGGNERFSKLVVDEFERNWYAMPIEEKRDLYKRVLQHR